MLKISSRTSLAVIVGIVLTFALVGSAYAIRNGIRTGDLEHSIMAVGPMLPQGGTATASGGALDTEGTVQNIFAPRCFVTAKHVTVGDTFWIYKGPNAHGDPAEGRWQRVARITDHPVGDQPWQDLTVFWVRNDPTPAGDPTHVRMREPGDYAPLRHNGIKPRGSGGIMGYGIDTAAEVPLGRAGVKRKGIAGEEGLDGASGLIRGRDQDPPREGGYYWTSRIEGLGQIGCPADSGGPLFAVTSTGAIDYGRTYGVLSQGNGWPSCAINAKYTSLDTFAPEGGQSNAAWVNRTATTLCAKSMGFNVPMEGNVQGSLANATYVYPDDFAVNAIVNCNPSDPAPEATDCTEYIHSTESGETITVTATPTYSDYVFKEWITPNGSANHYNPCPCVGQGATCVIGYEDVGYYGEDIWGSTGEETVSSDSSICEPVFEFSPSSSSSSSMSG